MNIKTAIAALAFLVTTSHPSWAGGSADPLLAKLMVDEFEQRSDQEQALSLQAWAGYDTQKLWLKAEHEASQGSTGHAELQLLYSHAIAPYWDIQTGLSRALEAGGNEDSLVIGIQGLAPYHFDVEAALFINEHAELVAKLELAYELRLSQAWVLEPELSLSAAAQHRQAAAQGAGIRQWQPALRLYYYPRREWAPYLGVIWHRLSGDSADYARERGEPRAQEQFAVGLTAWF